MNNLEKENKKNVNKKWEIVEKQVPASLSWSVK